MIASNIKFNKETLHQQGTVGQILLYIQDNPKFARDTNITQLSIMLSRYYGKKVDNLKAMLYKMVNSQLLLTQGGKHRRTFYINYWHKDIPGYILERVPEDVKIKVQKMKESLDQEHYINDEGCLVNTTNSKPVVNHDEEGIIVTESKEIEDIKETKLPKIEVNKTPEGITISITLNINLK